METFNFEKFDGINWIVFRKKFTAFSIKTDEINKSSCYDVIQYAEITYRRKGKPPPEDLQDAAFLAQFAKMRDGKKKSSQNLVYSVLAMSCIDACPGLVYAVDERRETCGSDLWMHFLSAYEPKPRSTFSIICSMIYQILFAIVWLVLWIIHTVFFSISLILGFSLFAIEILLDIVRAIIESLHLLGIPRLRHPAIPR